MSAEPARRMTDAPTTSARSAGSANALTARPLKEDLGRIVSMTDNSPTPYGELLATLTPDRRAHSLAVGRKVTAATDLVPEAQRSDLIAAAYLHDIGYGHAESGFHPIDGARFLALQGFSKAVCHLVAHHSASTEEARVRGIELAVFDEFNVEEDLGRAHGVLWWADMTTGPTGQDVGVLDRLDEICRRYGPDDPVTRFISRARGTLIAAGQKPTGSIQVSF